LFVNDAEEAALELPSGNTKIDVLQDRMFDEDNR
jgi:hypothetical protein